MSIKVERADRIQPAMWRELQAIGVRACQASFKDGFDAEAYMGWGEPERFVESHRDPNSEVGRRFNANQAYYGARVAVALAAGKPVGWLYIARHNVSGGGPPEGPHNDSVIARGKRTARLATTSHDYVWFRETYVNPSNAQSVIEKQLLGEALRGVRRDRPVAAYPEIGLLKEGEEDIYTMPWLESVGFRVTREYTKEISGFASVPAARMQHDSVRELKERLRTGIL